MPKIASVVPITLDELKDVLRIMEAMTEMENISPEHVTLYDSNGDGIGTVGWDNDMARIVFLPGS